MTPERLAEIQEFMYLSARFPDSSPMWATGGIALTWGDLRELLAAAEQWIDAEVDPEAMRLVRMEQAERGQS